MSVFQISSTTSNSTTKHRKSIGYFIKKVQHNRWRKQMARIDQNMQVITDLYVKGNPDIATKVNAVNNYVMRPDFTSPKIDDDRDRQRSICSYQRNTYEYLIGSCTDINEIYNEFGSYGLIAYAQNMLSDDTRDKLLPKASDYKISECICLSDKPANLTFNEYLMSNDKGYPSDIYQRFGQYGKDMLNTYMMSGYVGNGSADGFKGTYHTTSYFNTMIRDSYPLDVLYYQVNV